MGGGIKLTDSQRKKIVALRADGMSFREIAKKTGCSATSCQRVCVEESDLLRLGAEKKAENTRDMLAYLDGQRGRVQEVLSMIVDAMGDPQKLARANVRDLATAYGILVDKHTAQNEAQRGKENELLRSLIDLERARRKDGD